MRYSILLVLIVPFLLIGCTKSEPQQSTQTQPSSLQAAEITPYPSTRGSCAEKGLNERFGPPVLSGHASLFFVFNSPYYENALKNCQVIVLDFYASWCPICRAEEPVLKAGFDSLRNESIVGFRVNFNDPDTDETEKALAKQFNVPYQHTKIILKNGKEIGRYTNAWDAESFNKAIKTAL